MLKWSLCDYSNLYTLLKGKTTITGEGDNAAARITDKWKKKYYLKIADHLVSA